MQLSLLAQLVLLYSYRVFIKYCVFSKDFRIFQTPFSLGVSVCTHTKAGRTPALLQILQSSEKSQHFKEKTQYLMNTLYLIAYFKSFRFGWQAGSCQLKNKVILKVSFKAILKVSLIGELHSTGHIIAWVSFILSPLKKKK